MSLYQGLTPVALISSDFGSMSLGNEFIVPAQYVPMPTPIGEWRYTIDANETKILQEYLGNRTTIKVPFNHTMIQKYSDGTTNAPFYNRSYSTIENLDLMQVPFQDNVATRAFSNTTNIKSITNINQDITNIQFAFYNCKDLKKLNLTIPNSVHDSISYLCDGCTNLTDVKLNIESDYFYYSVQGIFNNCSNLTNLSLSVPNYRRGLDFGYNLTKLKNVELLNLNTLDSGYSSTFLYEYNSIENVKVTSNVQYNESSNKFAVYFDNCSAKNIIFDVPNFKDMSYLFRNMPNLENVSLNCPNVTNMWYAFENCQKLTSIPEIPNSVINLDYAFSNTGINYIPDMIGDNKNYRGCFIKCNNLTDVNTKFIGNNINMDSTFVYCNNLRNIKIEIDKNVSRVSGIFNGCNFNNLELITDTNKEFSTNCNVQNFIFTSNLSTISNYQFGFRNYINDFTLNCSNLESIYHYFYDCRNVQNITLNCPNITNVVGAFMDCFSLKNIVNMPTAITSMDITFTRCYNLVDAPVIPNSVTSLTSTFMQCYNLQTAPNIPDSVTSMSSTFYYCNNLTGNIYIHAENIITLSEHTFNYTSLPKNVYIPFTYENGVNTLTYNNFKQYYGSGQNGVTLYDINEL